MMMSQEATINLLQQRIREYEQVLSYYATADFWSGRELAFTYGDGPHERWQPAHAVLEEWGGPLPK